MGKKITICTFIDAFGWEVYKRYGFLDNILPEAKKLQTTFGFSSAADPSILTGRYPDEHTHWSCFYYAPDKSPFRMMKLLSILPRQIFDRGRVRHWLSKILAKFYGFTGYFQIYSVPFEVLPYFDYLEKQDYFVPGGILATDTIFDKLYSEDIPYHCSNWRLPEKRNLEIAKETIKERRIEFMYLYLPKLDAVMHEYGNNAPQVEEKIRWLEEQVSEVKKLAEEKYDEVAFYTISDHGMANVTESVDLISQIETLGLSFGEDYVAMYDSTMARFWFMNEEARSKITEKLGECSKGYIVSDEELKKMHVFFEDRKFGEVIFLMNEGCLIVPSFMGLKSIPGMHGYHPDDKDSYCFIKSDRQMPEDVNSITDIRRVLEREIFNV
ncbi:Type I phosphodiesterase / nucleotide pyrophosphatase [Sedimentisphaera cyanobacteriorum]|uniref:Type I phosphodiesterase / nucleotide pyrophosphatase n=1 Tax=Sedimentisphaera cyanobacteriorum TaxID=1940790 RepID=A0A1Q2HNY6_9BACT|nr:alkaline phosphatase family protein [Sedimentisphaera cyanobacteriorum]AQQ08943.1 Type I phosphodiesterase / nucleotide pyrophosphatase [Sedimentisphaera cyanobacteriorum]